MASTLRCTTDVLPEIAGGKKNNVMFLTRLAHGSPTKRATYIRWRLWRVESKCGYTTTVTNNVLIRTFSLRCCSWLTVLYWGQKGKSDSTVAAADRGRESASPSRYSAGMQTTFTAEASDVVHEFAWSSRQSGRGIPGRTSWRQPTAQQCQAHQQAIRACAPNRKRYTPSCREGATLVAARRVSLHGTRQPRERSPWPAARAALHYIQ